jgi:cytochrome P450
VTTDSFADYEKGGWARAVAKHMGHGVLVNDGDAWHASRALLKPLFKRNRAVDVRMLEPHAGRRVGYLRARQGAFVDFRQAAQMVVLDAITEMLTGESTLSLASSISASTKVKESGYSTEGAALLDLIDELEP